MSLNIIEPCEKIALQSLVGGICVVGAVDWWRDTPMGFWLSVLVCFAAAAAIHCVALKIDAAQHQTIDGMPKGR